MVKKIRAKCSVCNAEMGKFYGKKPIGICDRCRKVFCPKCVRQLKKGRCPMCNEPVEKKKMRLIEYPAEWGINQPIAINQGAGMSNTTVQVLEKVIVKEIVKIPCPYCKTLVENTISRCPECGGLMNA